MRLVLACCLVLASIAAAHAAAPHAACQPGAKWTEPAAPLKIHGNTWYVGTCGLSSILITSGQGHVLIDGDLDETAALIEASIRRLGFRVEDVRYILSSHEHFDHVGGIARLQHDSGARVLARAPAAAALERGHGDRSDPQFLSAQAFPPVHGVRRIDDGEAIRLGPIALTAHATPGHTPGSTTWTWQSCEQARCLDLVYADSLTAISDDIYRYSGDAQHAGSAAAFRASIGAIAALPCDILLTPHPDASGLWARLGPDAREPLIDRDGCRRYAENAAAKLDARLMHEQGSAAP